MRILGLTLGLICVASVASFAATATFDIYGGWETVACPLVPLNPEPSAVFGMKAGGTPATGLDFENGNPALRRWTGAGWRDYDYWSQPDTAFGGILLGDGYMVYNDSRATTTITVDGIENGVPATAGGAKTDMWISLPTAGWNLIGNPYNSYIPVDQDTGTPIYFTNGTEVKNWSDAANAQWVADSMLRFNGVRYTSVGLYYDEEQIIPAKGYYIYTKIPNIAMIIDASAL